MNEQVRREICTVLNMSARDSSDEEIYDEVAEEVASTMLLCKLLDLSAATRPSVAVRTLVRCLTEDYGEFSRVDLMTSAHALKEEAERLPVVTLNKGEGDGHEA